MAATLRSVHHEQALGTEPALREQRLDAALQVSVLHGIELVEDKATKTPLPVAKINELIARCKEKGLIIGKNGVTVAGFNNVLTLSPPLSITDEEKDFIATTLIDAFANFQ
jgi:adenosylmethionine-8-amino-7-oxononanoate aminotransferase